MLQDAAKRDAFRRLLALEGIFFTLLQAGQIENPGSAVWERLKVKDRKKQ